MSLGTMLVRSNGGQQQDDEQSYWDSLEIVVRGIAEEILMDTGASADQAEAMEDVMEVAGEREGVATLQQLRQIVDEVLQQ